MNFYMLYVQKVVTHFIIVTYSMKWATTSWTYSNIYHISSCIQYNIFTKFLTTLNCVVSCAFKSGLEDRRYELIKINYFRDRIQINAGPVNILVQGAIRGVHGNGEILCVTLEGATLDRY